MSVESVISCQDVVVIGKPISNLSTLEGDIQAQDYIVVSRKVEGQSNYVSRKYSFGQFDGNYVHLSGDEDIKGVKTFEKIVSQDIETEKLRSSDTEFYGTLINNADAYSNGKVVITEDGILSTQGNVIIDGKTTVLNGNTMDINMDDSAQSKIQITNTEGAISVDRVDSYGRKPVVRINSSLNNDLSVTIGNEGGLGERVYPFVVNPGDMNNVSSLDRIASTKYVHDNYCNLPKYEYDYQVLSNMEHAHDDDTVHKTGVETISGTKYLQDSNITRIVSSDGQFNVGMGFCYMDQEKQQIGYIAGMSHDGSNGTDNVIRIQSNTKDDTYATYIEIRSGLQYSGKRSITQNIEPANQYGQDLATTKWTRDEMIELSDQTHDYRDIVNAPPMNRSTQEYDKAKKSPSVTAIKDYYDNVVVPEDNTRLSNFLSNYLAYDFDGDGDEDNGKRIHLSNLRLVKFKAYYEHKDAEPIDFYVLTPAN